MQVRFRIKISNPEILSLDYIDAEMANSRLFVPKLVAAFLQTSSLRDLYLMVVEDHEEDEEQPAEAPTLQAILDEGFNAAPDTAVMALD
mmetsp:Transcript_32004/g.69036  ORF Transcript_32004/g.69036 Transcript_32004/m.69036 type:complete len:89 (+) Transcript_32004:223-489(+)